MKLFSKNSPKENKVSSENYIYDKLKEIVVSEEIDKNIKVIEDTFANNNGLIQRALIYGARAIRFHVFYIDGMVDKYLVDEHLIKPLIASSDILIKADELTVNYVKEKIFPTGSLDELTTFDYIIYELLSGSTIIFANGLNKAFSATYNDISGRNVEKPDSEQVVRGAKEAFVESLYTNIVLIRKRLKTPDLNIEFINAGKRSKTSLALVYIKGIINAELPKAIAEYLKKIDIDGIIGSGQVEQLIEKHKWTVFPQVLATERVDRIVGSLLDGRAAIIIDGSPYPLIVPTTFSMFLTSLDDYNGRTLITSLLRILRYIGFWVCCTISATYLAITNYNPGLIPTSLLLSITGSRVGLPFPVAFEIIFMEIALYFIQEATLRLPKNIGQSIGIVGALVIGQAVVQAGLVSPIIVVIVSISALASFIIPNYTLSLATIVIRLFFIIWAIFFGLFGVMLAAILVLIHAASLESFGIKYLSDYSPYDKETLKDTIIIAPQHTKSKRPQYLNTEDTVRENFQSRKENNE
ncbi:spore germination protein [Clostridium thermarum]|uniref:spore germination protein n=1 Tax=Clostridium thermarum TaxID=1716543 RepID=UPI0013D33873|nr:spore germination protein [Clostridium thermarum]